MQSLPHTRNGRIDAVLHHRHHSTLEFMTTSMDPAVLQNFGSSNPWQFWNLPHSSTKKNSKIDQVVLNTTLTLKFKILWLMFFTSFMICKFLLHISTCLICCKIIDASQWNRISETVLSQPFPLHPSPICRQVTPWKSYQNPIPVHQVINDRCKYRWYIAHSNH